LEELPLLEDIGIDLISIKSKFISILTFKKIETKFVDEADLSGPLLLALIFGNLLMLVYFFFRSLIKRQGRYILVISTALVSPGASAFTS